MPGIMTLQDPMPNEKPGKKKIRKRHLAATIVATGCLSLSATPLGFQVVPNPGWIIDPGAATR